MTSTATLSSGRRVGGRIPVALSTGCLVTVLAQIEPRLSIVFTVLWLAIVLYLAVLHRQEARFVGMSFATVAVAVLLVVYCAVCYLISGEIGYITGFCQLYLKCLLMYLIGFLAFFSRDMGVAKWNAVFAAYVAASCLYVVWAMARYFPGMDAWMSSELYLFASKNSLGQIVGVAVVLLMVLGIRQDSSAKRTALWGVGGMLACCILLIQCRTAFFACCLALACLLVFRRQKRALGIMVVVLAACIALSPDLQGFLSHAFFLDKYDGAGANAMSSGRLGLWAEALGASEGHELMGVGDYYVDNMYIDLYANLGIAGFALVMCAWVPRVVANFKYGARAFRNGGGFGALGEMIACLTAFYLVESMLEGHPPFGPGTCSFMFWMLCGYLDGDERRR